MLALVTEWALSIGAIGSLVGAVLAFVYLPSSWGRYVSAGLVALAAGLGSYQAGYVARGRLDVSAALQMQLDLANKELSDTKTIQEDAASRARESEQQAADLQEKINAYETALAAKPSADCLLSPDDVRALDGLRDGSGAGDKSSPPGAAR